MDTNTTRCKKLFDLMAYLREIDEDIEVAEEQAGAEKDEDISDGDPDDEDLSDA